jgi:L-fucose isomerase-like protein
MTPLRIAFFPIVRIQFDIALAEEMISKAREHLRSAGFELVGPEQAISDLPAAQAAAQMLSSAPVDLALIFQATFADSSMVVALSEAVDAPIFLWSVPEAWTGERLRLNSLCGINLAGHALTLRKLKYDYAYGTPEDTEIIEKIRSLALAGSLYKRLKTTRLGVVGEHPVGMDTCHLDEAGLKALFGIEIRHIALEDVFASARAISNSTISQTRALLDTRLDNLATLEQVPLNGTMSVYNALKQIASEQELDGLAVRCWPEFFTEMGCAACGAMSMLSDGFGQSTPLPCSCEADINGTVTQMMLQILADAPAFGTDIVGVDQAKDLVALWHCGLAPLSMADPNMPAQGSIHSNRRVPLVMDFALRPGEITFARISQATGDLRLVVGKGQILPVPKPFNGTSGTLKLDIPARSFLDTLMHEGLEHHISIAYGNHLASLVAFAKLAQIPVLNLS